MMGLVSIITATYNSSETIESTYASIRNQTYSNWEWLVTDDCSNDSTLSILKNMAMNDSRIKIYQNEVNSGAATSRNNSMRNSQGEFIAFIDSDDLWVDSKLESQLRFMTSQNCVFSFTAYECVDDSGNSLGVTVDSKNIERFSYKDMLTKRATLGCSTVILKKAVFKDVLYMPLLRTGQDYAFWLKLLKTIDFAYLHADILTKYRVRPNSISRNKFRKSLRQWQIYREVEGLSFSYSFYCFCFYAFRAVFRKK